MTVARNIIFLGAFLTAIVLAVIGHERAAFFSFAIAVVAVWR